MTIIEAISKIDALNPNAYTQSEKIGWLSTLDGIIKRQIIDTHEGGDSVVFNVYNNETPLDTELIAKEPYSDMYIDWLESKIGYYDGEIAKYNNSLTKFSDTYRDYQNDYNRTYMPQSTKIKYW